MVEFINLEAHELCVMVQIYDETHRPQESLEKSIASISFARYISPRGKNDFDLLLLFTYTTHRGKNGYGEMTLPSEMIPRFFYELGYEGNGQDLSDLCYKGFYVYSHDGRICGLEFS